MTIDKEVNPRFESTFKVYKHVFPNGKIYIGITSRSLNQRWQHGKGYSGYVRKAIDKYGWDNIKHFVLVGDFTEDEAKLKERQLIAKYNSNNPEFGYNLTQGGDGTLGFTQPEHVRYAVSKANSERLWSEESRQKSSKAKLGCTFSEEHKRKIGDSRRGKPGCVHTEEFKQRVSQQFKGKRFTQEHKDKISAALKGRKKVVT